MKMSVIRWILTIAIIAVSIVMTVVILMQEGRSQGLGAISGAAETYWGKNKGRSMEGFLEKFTTGLVVAFFILAILLNMQLF
jgi:preprotein translocase subunit SecG